MAILAPFRGLTYNFLKIDDLAKVVTPPYDVISEKEQEAYYQVDPHNVIRLILGKKKTGDSDWDNRYTRAADSLKRWQSKDILTRSNYPCMYLTSHTYDPGDGKKRIRWGLITLVRIEDEGSGVILPHEKTFSAHKNDRLNLMRACNAQLSQVFGLFDDPGDQILQSLKTVCKAPPRASFEFKDNTWHDVWEVLDQSVLKTVAEGMRDKSIFIADGHHRYETSRNYRNMMRARYGTVPENRSYEYIMMYLTNMSDKGLTILPSHRLIKNYDNFNPKIFLDRIGQWFEIEEIPILKSNQANQLTMLKKALKDKGKNTSAMVFYYHSCNQYYLISSPISSLACGFKEKR